MKAFSATSLALATQILSAGLGGPAAAQPAPAWSAVSPAAPSAASGAASAAPAPAARSAVAPALADSASPLVLEPVSVVGRTPAVAGVAGWGDAPLARTPVQASVTTAEQLKDFGLQRLADLIRLDPAVSDAYNAEGYVDDLSVRGYPLDNRFNVRRDGLPINAETSIPLENKAQVEILKGTSGLQTGTSAPGGLVNYVVKRPLEGPLRTGWIEWRQPGTWTAAVDLSQRLGTGGAVGVRLNAAASHLDPMVRDSVGHRSMLALALDARISPDTLLEAEIETSRRTQPSQPGFSLLGDRVPSPVAPRTNLNDQPWSQPVVFGATTGSLRWQQKLAGDWRFVAHGVLQRLGTDDRLAFPFGCSTANGSYYPDRYCPDGSFDLYDFRSEGERRRSAALDLSLGGRWRTGRVLHTLSFGLLESRVQNRFNGYASNPVGTGNVDGTLVTPPDPTPNYTNTNRDERSTELHARDAIVLNDRLTAWLGVRHTRLRRTSVQTDGSQPTDHVQSATSPFVALSAEMVAGQFVYASWGRGLESQGVPNLPRYTNAGAAFALTSRQIEAGWKGVVGALAWNLAAFDIQRPRTADVGVCGPVASCTTQVDGSAHHRGVEADASWQTAGWTLAAGLQLLRARIENSADPTLDGRRPTNVPGRTLKAQAAHDIGAVPGLNAALGLVVEGPRAVLPDDSVSIPGYARADGALRYRTRLGSVGTTWRAGVDNLLDRRAWREAPYQYSHAYLYPLLPRTWRLSAEFAL